MAFIQLIDYRSSRNDEIIALRDTWQAGTEGKRTARRSLACVDRDDPTHHQVIVFFDSFESAMENSNLPGTAEFSEAMGKLVDGPVSFTNLDVIDDLTM